jgi:hypothetical protein
LPAGVPFATPAQSWTPAVGGASFTASGKTVFNTPLDGGGTVVGVNDRAAYFGDQNGLTLVRIAHGVCFCLQRGGAPSSLAACVVPIATP